MLLLSIVTGPADSTYDKALERRFAEPKGSTNYVSVRTDTNAVALEQALKAEQMRREQGSPVAAPAVAESHVTPAVQAAGLLVVLLVFLRIVWTVNHRYLHGRPLSKREREQAHREKVVSEEPTVSAFFHALQQGLEGTGVNLDQVGPFEDPQELQRKLQKFYDFAPTRITGLLAQLSSINRTKDTEARVKSLRECFTLLDAMKQESRFPALRPVWLMTCGLEGLILQIIEKPTEINASVLRAIAGAVGMLKALCVQGVDPDLATRRPVEILGVDDNAVCLSALSMALKKAFRRPDTAPEGTTALAMIEKKRYDAIFLDVEMPGMDGFELCTKIRQTELNRNTPVIFVTSHGDFESRAKAESVGAQDLIAKPYLSFEITVKALTVAMRGRLASDAQASSASASEKPEECVAA